MTAPSEQNEEVFSKEELGFLLRYFEIELAPQSPLKTIASVASNDGALKSLKKRSIINKTWSTALKRIAAAKEFVEITYIASDGPIRSVFYPDKRKKSGGYLTTWEDDDSLSIFFPCREEELLATFGEGLDTINATPPGADFEYELSDAALTALMASVDFLRTLLFASMLQRQPLASAEIRKEDLEEQIVAGVKNNDLRWSIALLAHLFPSWFPVVPGDFEGGIQELVETEFLLPSNEVEGSWQPHPELLTLAYNLTSPLPALSLSRTDKNGSGNRVMVVLRGNGIWHLTQNSDNDEDRIWVHLKNVDGLTSLKEIHSIISDE